jgi:hypothetical protein
MIEHPFFSDIGGYNGRVAIEAYLRKQIKLVDDHIDRCNELAGQTNVLISLIFNIATLQDTKAAVEESKAANAFAASIRRVTVLTFIYLPLTLASVSILLRARTLFCEVLIVKEHPRHEHHPSDRREWQYSALGVFRRRFFADDSDVWRVVCMGSVTVKTREEDKGGIDLTECITLGVGATSELNRRKPSTVASILQSN